VLVSTTVIEVGVDVANASIMVIEDANRFASRSFTSSAAELGGVSGRAFACCRRSQIDDARARMDVMVSTTDGFKIAEEDLKLRGPGELAGTKQSGNLDFKIADLVQDGLLLEVSRQAAMQLIRVDPQLQQPDHAGIKEKIQERRSQLAVVTIS